VVSSEVGLAILKATMLVLRRIYVVVEGIVAVERIAAAVGIEVVDKAIEAIEVVVCVLVIAKVCGLEAVSKVSEVYKV